MSIGNTGSGQLPTYIGEVGPAHMPACEYMARLEKRAEYLRAELATFEAKQFELGQIERMLRAAKVVTR